MKGITITRDIKTQFDERISFLKNRLFNLQEQYNSCKVKKNVYSTSERLKCVNPDWRMQNICFSNELALMESILKDAVVVE